jgi:2-methylcitrate dehydratase PrpD
MNIMTKPMRASEVGAENSGLTRKLATDAAGLKFEDLSAETRMLARQCLLDYVAVALAGARDPVSNAVLAEMSEQGGTPSASAFGRGAKLPASSAALVNGTFAHALDFDDVNLAMPGHPTVAAMPAVLALAEERGSSGADVITAFVAGYELMCRVGLALQPGHYNLSGFHATGTVGSLGAAAAAARLLDLSAETATIALGIAATQAAGLKSQFGTDCKPFHAGKAASNGLLAARLAARGFSARPDAIECRQGFALAHGPDFDPAAALAPPARGTHIRSNLFKYHAACYLTHATIEGCRRLREKYGLSPDSIAGISLRLDESCDRVCNIAEPKTGLEAKFSLRQTAAMALAGMDTSGLDSYSETTTADERCRALRQKVRLDWQSGWPQARTEVTIETTDGRSLSLDYDAGVPTTNVDEQGRRLEEKFRALVEPLYGRLRTARIIDIVHSLDTLRNIRELVDACAAPTHA